MQALLGPLQYAILPVFAFPLLGYLFGLRGSFSRQAAAGINEFVAGVALPCLLFRLLGTADLSQIDWPVVFVYQGSQVLLYLTGWLICRYALKLSMVESLILGMCAAFPNHVYFVLPIAEELYGHGAKVPVATMVAFDSMTLLCATVLLLEMITGKGGIGSTLRSIVQNRLILGIVLGLLFNASGFELHQGVERFLVLAGAGAAPASLFALGVILSGAKPFPVGPGAWVVTALKVGVHPLIAVLMIGPVITASPDWAGPAPLVFAAPCASTGFVLGLRYGAPVESVAKAIILSTVLSVFVIALLA